MVPGQVGEVFAFFAQARNLERITPPWLRFSVRTPEPIEMLPGALIEYDLRLHALPLRWVTRIEEWVPGRSFVDRQLRGPYRSGTTGTSSSTAATRTLVRDRVDYALPLGVLGELAHVAIVRRDLDRIFDFRP